MYKEKSPESRFDDTGASGQQGKTTVSHAVGAGSVTREAHHLAAIRVGKLNGDIIAVVQPTGTLRKRYKLGKHANPFVWASQLREATSGYRYSPVADVAVRRILKDRVRNAIGKAVRLAWENDITVEWAVELYDNQNGKCALTGLPLDTGPVRAESGRDRRPFRPSLDRIDSSRGYTKDNVRLVCSCVNYALGPWGEAVLRTMAAALIAKG